MIEAFLFVPQINIIRYDTNDIRFFLLDLISLIFLKYLIAFMVKYDSVICIKVGYSQVKYL